MKNRLVRNAAIAVCFLTWISCALFAQEFTGRVFDNTGASIPSVKVTVRNQLTGTVENATTTKEGFYTIPYLKPGLYTLSVDATGFRPEQKTDITLQVGQTANLDFALEVGNESQTVTVQANPLIDFSADRGEVVETERVTELPLNSGRDPDMLSILNPGVIWTGAPQWQRPFDNTMANLTINGGQGGNNELLVDGAPNESADGNGRSAYVPPVESVQEFKIITNPYNALYGRAGGGVMDLTLKSGTNTLHGNAYEFYRRGWLDANTWQDNYYGNTRETHKLDQYGAELDGPVRIPRLYNGRDKLFFLMQMENYNEIVPSTSVQSVPSPQWLQGDFSNLVQWNGSPITIYDPLTIHQTGVDGSGNPVYARNAFPGNKIPSGRLNSIAQTLVSYFPAPNVTVPSGQNPFANNFQAPNPTTDLYRNALAKLDYNLGPNDRFSLRYGYWIRTEYRPGNGISGPAADGQLPGGTRSHTFSTEWVHTQTPNLLFALVANVVVRQDFQISGPRSFDFSKLGWSSSQLAQFNATVPFSHFPQIGFSEFDQIGNWGAHLATGEGLSIIPNMTWIKGRHTFHAGIDMRFLQLGTSSNQDNGSFLWTDRTWTQQNYIPSQWDDGSGNSFSSFLLGTATNGNFSVQSTSFNSQHYYAPFVQDDWKVTKKLTLNLGVRWDLNGPQVERHNRMDGPFQFDVANPVSSDPNLIASDLPAGTSLNGGISFVGTGGNIRSLYHLNKNNIQPRAGFIYSINDKTAIRGGLGEMILNPTPGANTLGYSAYTNYVATQDNWKTPLNNLSMPYSQVVQPLGSKSGLETNIGNGQSYSNPNFKMPNFWFYSFGVERQFAQHDVVEASFVGTQTKHLDSSQNMNPASRQWMARCNPDLGGDPNICINDVVPNPFQNVAAFNNGSGDGAGNSFYGSPTISGSVFARPLPVFGDISESELNSRKSWYNSLQVAGSHRWNKSFTVHGTWTWSKTMDAGGWSGSTAQVYGIASRNIDGNDRTHRITLSGVYLLPVGRGRPLLGKANRLVDAVVGGWEIAPLYIYETGTPWTFSGMTMVHSAKVSRHFDSTGYIRGVDPCVSKWLQNSSGKWVLTPLYNTAANQNTGLYDCQSGQTDFIATNSYGADANLIYSGIRIPSDNQFDANLSKNFAIWERMSLQLRLEAFDVLNHPQWQEGYISDPQNSNFGEITRGPWGQSNLPREVQIALKLSW